MAKLLPCDTLDCHFALWTKGMLHPEGEPAICGQYVEKYTCTRCQRMNTMTPQRWHSLPEMTLEHFEALTRHFQSNEAKEAIRGLPTSDLEAWGIKRDHARDLFRAGLGLMDLKAAERGAEAKANETDSIN